VPGPEADRASCAVLYGFFLRISWTTSSRTRGPSCHPCIHVIHVNIKATGLRVRGPSRPPRCERACPGAEQRRAAQHEHLRHGLVLRRCLLERPSGAGGADLRRDVLHIFDGELWAELSYQVADGSRALRRERRDRPARAGRHPGGALQLPGARLAAALCPVRHGRGGGHPRAFARRSVHGEGRAAALAGTCSSGWRSSGRDGPIAPERAASPWG